MKASVLLIATAAILGWLLAGERGAILSFLLVTANFTDPENFA